ncbi:Stage II sporulation protein E (SpoIIE) [Novipirellula aureliae]|uniref:Stage II sporulation protein E (SpoIIE) n=1 Tax=Novipirellula aureliae TaxID=2527966 RepID=A0A5C6EA35_9BACT|nr:SpoIIE family protein phosphatase [Novipirellula aureliae]TWU45718.1 Stage II sporulation protein E (SpoIIE) [Novipirellula aureliae]
MTKNNPSYLRIHHGPATTRTGQSDQAVKQRGGNPAKTRLAEHANRSEPIERFWQVFGDSTGWRIDRSKRKIDATISLLPSVNSDCLTYPNDRTASIAKPDAKRLAEAAMRMSEELIRLRETLRNQEMELAARAAILPTVAGRGALADRMEGILLDAIAATRCDVAVIYLLDDNTERLTARASCGITLERLEQLARPLQGSRGDLEAMVQGVVTVDDFLAGDIDTWNRPESFVGGICAAILNDSVPIGTLWLFSEEGVTFTAAESAVARLAAKAIATEISTAAASEFASPKAAQLATNSIQDLAEWQHLSLPVGNRIADGWKVDGMLESPNSVATGWHSWDILPDGTIMLAMAEAIESDLRGSIGSVVARSALTAHSNYRHNPKQMLSRIADTLWQTNSGDQLMSMIYFHFDPESGDGSYASAGNLTAMISSRYGYRPLVDGSSEPLGTSIDAHPMCGRFSVLPSETLLCVNRGMLLDGATQSLLGDSLRTSMTMGDTNPLAAIRRNIADRPLKHERAAMTLLRQK